MKKELLLVLFSMTLISAKCANNQVPHEYFNRPDFDQCITLDPSEGEAWRGKMACGGEVIDIPAGLRIMKDFANEDIVENYYEDKVKRLYFCLNSRRCQ